MYSDSDCSSSDFVYGTARGLRTFTLTADGVLRGVTYPVAWQAGENLAQCLVVRRHADHDSMATWTRDPEFYEVGGLGIPRDPDGDTRPLTGYVRSECTGVEAGCACGFYAYHDPDAAPRYGSRHGAQVTGVVEAYGKVIVGPLGFRASKARVLAIVPPAPREASERLETVRRAIEDIDEALSKATHSKWAVNNGCLSTAGIAAAVTIFQHPFWGGVLLVGAVYSELLARLRTRPFVRNALMRERMKLEREYDALPRDYTETMALCRERYPDVDFCDNVNDMRMKWPVVPMRALVEEGKGDK